MRSGRHELADDCALFGVDPALFAETDDDDGLWPENAPALEAFLAVTTQWRVVATAKGPLFFAGIDYQGARAGFDLAGIAMTPEVWADVQMIEAGAWGALNRRRS